MEQRGVCDRLKEKTSAKRRKSRVGTYQINKLETQHTGTYNIVICYGVGKGTVDTNYFGVKRLFHHLVSCHASFYISDKII